MSNNGDRTTHELVEFRQKLYACFTRWRDALFELTDAALCASGPLSSVPALSLEPEFTRSHASLYEAQCVRGASRGPPATAPGRGRFQELAARLRGRRVDLGPLRR